MIGDRKECIRFLATAPDKTYEVKIHREKRSLTANAYYQVLLSKLSETISMSRTMAHNTMLRRYGKPLIQDGKVVTVTFRADVPFESLIEWIHLEPIWSDGEQAEYRVLRGSRTFDTKEMSTLLDGLISECKDCGIETMTPQELERLKGYEAQTKYYH